jgi:hypothetical protein
VDYTFLYLCIGKAGFYGFCKSFQIINGNNEDVLYSTVFHFIQHSQPELGGADQPACPQLNAPVATYPPAILPIPHAPALIPTPANNDNPPVNPAAAPPIAPVTNAPPYSLLCDCQLFQLFHCKSPVHKSRPIDIAVFTILGVKGMGFLTTLYGNPNEFSLDGLL